MTRSLQRYRHTVRHIACTTLITVAVATVASARPVTNYKGNGGYVEISGDIGGCTWVYLWVSRGGTQSAPATYLYYDMYDYCAGRTIGWGSGSIDNSAFKLTKTKATLAVTPASSAAFYTEGTAGAINLVVTPKGNYWYSYSGHSRGEAYGRVWQSHGSWSYSTGTPAGSMFGQAIDSASSSVGEGRDKYMEFDRSSAK